MLPEQKSLLSNFFSRFRRNKPATRKTRRNAGGFFRNAQVEELEARRLLVSRVFLDFGDGFTAPTTGPYAGLGTMLGIQPAQLRTALTGAGVATDNKYEDSVPTGILGNFANFNPALNMVGLFSLLGIGTPLGVTNPVAPTDVITMELAITAQIQRALEPFDIQVISSARSNIFNFPIAGAAGAQLANASTLMALNNLPGDGGSPVNGTAKVPQGGSDDVYVYFGGLFQNVVPATNPETAVAANFPISAEFAAQVPNSAGGKPDRLDSGAIIDVQYWITRVLGDPTLGTPGTGGSLNVALANAALYAIGWDYGLSEVENSSQLFTNFSDPNVTLINQANAMPSGGFAEGFFANGQGTIDQPISDQHQAFFTRFDTMQNGVNFQPLLVPGSMGQPPLLAIAGFPLPPAGTILPVGAILQTPTGQGITASLDGTINEDPSDTVNTYQQLANDPDIGANPDVAYVTGTGAFDQITIKKINATQAQVTVKAFTDNTYTNLIQTTADGSPMVGTMSYTINLTKQIIPGRLDDGQPFRIVIEGCTNDDQIFLDPTLGVRVEIHGGPDVKTLNISGNGAYNLQYTPATPPPPINSNADANSTAEGSLISEGLIPGAAGVLAITGTTSSTTKTKVGNNIVTKTVVTPFTTTVAMDHFNPANASALRVQNFNSLTYKSPGFLNNDFNVDTMPIDGSWQISGQVFAANPLLGSLQTGNLQFTNVGQLVFDTTRGASSDTITFNADVIAAPGLKSVTVNEGAGNDTLHFNDATSLENVTYTVSPTLVLPQIGSFQPFQGFFYSGVETLTIDGTSGTAKYVVTPSLTTAININGDSVAPDTSTLAVRLAGTTGAPNPPPAPPAGVFTFTSGHQPVTFTGINNVIVTQPAALVEAGDAGSKPLVKVFNAQTKALEYMFYAYEQTFRGGVHVATADVTGDGVPDIIVTPGLGRAAEVKVYDGAMLAAAANALHLVTNPAAALVADFFPEAAGYRNGLFVAAGDVTGDAIPDIVVSHARGKPMVRVFQGLGGGTFSQINTIVPYGANVISGVQVAVADVDGDGISEVITAPGPGQIATVKVFNATTSQLLRQFNGFETNFRNGVSLTAADLDGDGKAEIVLGAGTGGKSRVRIFNASLGTLDREFQAFTTGAINTPLRVAAIDPDTAGFAQIYVTQSGRAATHETRLFDPLSGALVDKLIETNPDLVGGFNLG